ncbi:MAG: hypothetical protein HQL10_04790 [Nitrospirae bacterium]|nr:hypothetical protein [Nitrospirota bacterium]
MEKSAKEIDGPDVLDLSYLSAIQARLLNETAEIVREPFISLIDSLSVDNADNMDWWVSNLSSRNVLLSSFYVDCCYLALIQELLRRGYALRTIKVNSVAMAETVNLLLRTQSGKIRVENVKCPAFQRLKSVVRFLAHFILSAYRFFLRMFAMNVLKCSRRCFPDKPLTLLDVFVFENSFKDGTFADRYYTGFQNFLSEDEKRLIFYVPTLHKVKNIIATYRSILKSGENFLLKEVFLTCADYLYALGYPFRVGKIALTPKTILNMDVTPLMKAALYQDRASYGSMDALLNYRFAERLAEAGIRLRLVVDWFENQVVDRGFNAGFRRFYNGISHVGYQGFVAPDRYLSLFPSNAEYAGEVIPQHVIVVGKALVDRLRQACPNLDVGVGPAFRFGGVWAERKDVPDPSLFTILIALPIMMREGNDILKLAASCLENKMLQTCHFLIKQHPTNKREQILKYFGSGWPNRFQFSDEDVDTSMNKASLLISSASSVCMEALARGIPVIIVGSSSGLTYTPVPHHITDDIWSLCYTSDELMKAILYYKSRDEKTVKRHEALGKDIRGDYFEPVTRESVRRFLQLDPRG